MATRGNKVMVTLDAELVRRAREEVARESDSDGAVVERVLDAYLMGRVLDATQRQSGLSEQEAERLTYEDLRVARRKRGPA